MSVADRRDATSIDYRRPYRSAPVALANAVGGALGRAGFSPVSLDEASLIAAAERAAGLRYRADDVCWQFHVTLLERRNICD